MKKFLVALVIFLAIATTQANAFSVTPQQVISTFDFADKVTIQYQQLPTDRLAQVTTYFYPDGNRYVIKLNPVPFTELQLTYFLHEVGHIFYYENNISTVEYYFKVHTDQPYLAWGTWGTSLKESFAEDFKVYISEGFYGIDTTNTTIYNYNDSFVGYINSYPLPYSAMPTWYSLF
jgi:hypothetical protein